MRRRRSLHASSSTFATFAMFALGLACNAISGLDQDYELASSGGAEAGQGNDGQATTDSPIGSNDGNTTSDGTTSNDGSATDAKNDGTPQTDAEAGGSAFCTTAPKPNFFCSDFENAPNWGWASLLTTGGTPVVEANIGSNLSHGLHTLMAAGASGSKSSAVVKSIPITWADGQTVTLSFAFKIKQGGVYAVLGAIEFNSVEYGLAVYPTNCGVTGAPCVDENDNTDFKVHNSADSFKYTQDQWHNAVVKVVRVGNKFGGSVTVDGVALDKNHGASGAIPGPGDTFSPTPTIPTSFNVYAGAFYSGNPGTTEVIVDDVLVQ